MATLMNEAAPSVLFRPDPTPLVDFLRKAVAVEPSAYAWEKREDTLLIQGSAGMVHLLTATPTALKSIRQSMLKLFCQNHFPVSQRGLKNVLQPMK